MELNPNNPIAGAIRSHWHKLAAMIMLKQGLTEIHFTMADVDNLAAGNVNIVIDARSTPGDVFSLRIVDDATAAILAKREGGRPEDS